MPDSDINVGTRQKSVQERGRGPKMQNMQRSRGEYDLYIDGMRSNKCEMPIEEFIGEEGKSLDLMKKINIYSVFDFNLNIIFPRDFKFR